MRFDIIIGEPVLHIIDYKNGLGVPVDCRDNPQLKIYALGALAKFGNLFDITEVRMSIVQPRRQNIGTYTMPVDELYMWGDTVLRPTAKLAYDGEGEFKSGEHCRFCRAKATCRKRAEENLALAQYEFAEPALLDDAEIAIVLGKVDALTSWAGDVKGYALSQALRGAAFEGWKLVEGRSNRKYVDEAAVADVVTALGLDPFEHKILGVTAMTVLLGKKRFNDSLGGLITKPAGKPVLVAVSDKRDAITVNSSADDFAEDFPADNQNFEEDSIL